MTKKQTPVSKTASGTRKVPQVNGKGKPLNKVRPQKPQVVKTTKQVILPKENKNARLQQVRVQPITTGEVAGLILRELSDKHSDICNFVPEAILAQKGENYLAYVAVTEKCNAVPDVSPRHVWVKAQAIASLKKTYDPAFDRYVQTTENWFKTEHKCRRINQLLVAWSARENRYLHRSTEHPFSVKAPPFISEVGRVREFLRYVFGVKLPLDRILQAAHHGSGSTTDVSGRSVHYMVKHKSLACTPLATELAAQALVNDKAVWLEIGMDPTYSYNEDAREGFVRIMREELNKQLVTGDKLSFIHKGIDSLRSIGVQPTCNVLLQLGADTTMKNDLKDYAGIDLADQSWNQHLARKGSEDWESIEPFCTLDKSNASNSIARLIPTFFFPGEWAKFFQKTRTPSYTPPAFFGKGSEEIPYQMYAGMGNGTTFTVETALFAAFCYATSHHTDIESFVKDKEYAVYGDDVVLKRSHARRYITLATYFGFSFNSSKTFLDGPFRESCGADYWSGIDVRPAYVKSSDTELDELSLIGVHNTLVDHPTFPLQVAPERMRELFRKRIHFNIPTDPAGGNGFRPVDIFGGYTIVRDKAGKPVLSDFWQRPRFYTYEVRPKKDSVECIGPWMQIAASLAGGTQVRGRTFGFPFRQLTNRKLVAEQDMRRSDLILMVANQLSRLKVRKSQPWYDASRGRS